MPTNRLSWRSLNSGSIEEDGFRVYRDTVPFTSTGLPAVLADVPGADETYDDTTAVADTVYYYMIEVYRGTVSKFSALISTSTVSRLVWDQLDELAAPNFAIQEDGFQLWLDEL